MLEETGKKPSVDTPEFDSQEMERLKQQLQQIKMKYETSASKINTNNVEIVAFQKNGLKIIFDVSKQANEPNVTLINAKFSNSLSYPMQNFDFKAAVPKVMKYQATHLCYF